MLYLILLSTSILFLINLLLIYSIKKVFNRSKNENDEVNISIVIAAKNEAGNIEQLLNTLRKLDYPANKYEMIVVDDNSADNTLEILNSQKVFQKNLVPVDLSSENKKGKRDALSLGISKAKYPNILITDADCIPQKNWLKSYSNYFSLGYDMLFGIAPFIQNKSIVNKIACFENLRSTLLSFSMASIGLPYTAAARNFGFTKEAFELLGGYSRTKDTLSGDDDLLLREAVKKKLKIGVITDKDSFVYSDTKKSFKDYLHQKARHTQSSLHYLKKHQAMLGFWHLFNLYFLFSPLLLFFNLLFVILFPVKLLIDTMVNTHFQKKLGYKFTLTELFILQIFYEVLIVVNFLNASFSKIRWK